VRLRGDAAANTKPYELWPHDLDRHHEIDRALSAGFYGAVRYLPVFRVRDEAYEWQEIAAGAWDLPEPWHERLVLQQ
jgi:hypothetical protein